MNSSINFAKGATKGGTEGFETTPGGEMDEENIVMFHSKNKFEKFIQEYLMLQNTLYIQSGKYYVPSIICNSPRDIQNEVMILLRNCDILQNYQLKHMKYSKLGENFKVYHFAFIDNNPINWKEQLLNDLRNFFENEGLELIGAINDP